ncbi:MAG: SprB repeat-containing protein, partial [Bacteroidia bacterium]|nr:SprB repeat-containing protein [Bacteroidia bacterium]
MNRKLQLLMVLFFVAFIGYKAKACHGLALVNYNVVVGPTGVTVNGSSNGATCGCGPYWMQVEIACTAAGLTGLPSPAVQNTIDNWAGPGTTYNAHPWYFGLLNVPNYTIGNFWPDQCVVEPYTPVFIPFTALCPGQTYFLRSREWLGGSTAVPPAGPWSAVTSFVVPGTYTPLNFSVTATPANYCAPNSATLSITNVASSACGNTTYSWAPGGSTATSIVVSPAVSTTYSVTVNAPCQTPITKTITVNVGVTPSAAFTGAGGCTNAPLNFNHTGTAGVTHTWSATPAAGVNIVSANIANPVITFANAGTYAITHVVSNGTCSHTVTSNVTITAGPNPAFTVPAPVQCLNGNSFSFNAATPGGTHSYTFNPTAGAPASGGAANYGPGSFTAPGTYTVFHQVSVGGCTSFSTAVLNISPHPSLTLIPNPAICGGNNGSILINNTTPAGQTVVSFSLNGTAIVTQTPTGLPSGAYTVAFTNNFGCITSSVTNIANTPGVTNLATTFTNPACGNSNGSIALGAVTGGTGPFTYSVNNGPFSAAPPLTNLPAGTYVITVKDVNNCVFTKTVTLVNTPPPTNITFTTSPTACIGNTGVLGITGVTGGTPAYTFSVNGISTSSIT